jgi:hypothetical protein
VFRSYYRGKKDYGTINASVYSLLIANGQRYANIVGNVLGTTSYHNAYEITDEYPWDSSSTKYIYGTNCGTSTCDNNVRTTLLRHRNYDYVSAAIKQCDGSGEPGCQGGDTDNTLVTSYAYAAKPSWWCNESLWPPIGPDVAGYHDDIPAKIRYDGGTCTLAGGSSVPVLTSPIDNATGLMFPITFTWQAFTGAVEYELQVDNNSDFSSPEMDIFTADTTVEGDDTDGLLPGVHYYWRVRALK